MEDKVIKLKDAEGAIKELLERRLAELDKQRLISDVTENPYFEREEKEIWAEGYAKGYTDLLEDLKNLIECGWLGEITEGVQSE